MKYLLDANAIIAILKGTPTLLQRLHKHVPADFGLPSIVSHELVVPEEFISTTSSRISGDPRPRIPAG